MRLRALRYNVGSLPSLSALNMTPDILHHYPTFPDDLIEAVRLRRKALGYSLDALSEATGLTKKTLIRLEKGEDIRMSSFLIVMQALDMTFDYTFQTRMALIAHHDNQP